MDPREQALREAVLNGSEAAWRALYDEHFDALYAFVWHRAGRNSHRTDEAVQEIWLAAVYAAGLATVWLGWPREAVPPAPASPKMAAAVPVGVPEPQSAPAPEDLSTLPPEELRRRVAGAPRAEQRRLLRLAGDRYLYGTADIESALDCYRQVLELTPRTELARHDADESWLLAELKSSEIHYANRLGVE